MDTLELTRCPELVTDGVACGAPAEVIGRFVLESTEGPLEHLRTRCMFGHMLTCLAESFAEPDLLSSPANQYLNP